MPNVEDIKKVQGNTRVLGNMPKTQYQQYRVRIEMPNGRELAFADKNLTAAVNRGLGAIQALGQWPAYTFVEGRNAQEDWEDVRFDARLAGTDRCVELGDYITAMTDIIQMHLKELQSAAAKGGN